MNFEQGGGGDAEAAAPPPSPLPRRAGPASPATRGGHCAEKEGREGGPGARNEIGRIAGRAASASASASASSSPSPVGRRPTPGEITADHRDANTYFAILIFYNVVKHINTAPPEVALAPQCALCGMLDGYGGKHPVKTRYENAMPFCSTTCRSTACRHTRTTSRGSCATWQSSTWMRTCSSRVHGMDIGSRKMTITINARNRGMTAGRAVTYALADPAGAYSTGRRRSRRRGCPRAGQGATSDDGGRLRGARHPQHGRLPPPCRRRSDGMTAGCGPRQPSAACAPLPAPARHHDRLAARHRSPPHRIAAAPSPRTEPLGPELSHHNRS